jgi:hypothetical protein
MIIPGIVSILKRIIVSFRMRTVIVVLLLLFVFYNKT